MATRLIVVGSIGSDAGYWVLGPDGWHHVGGWAPEAMVEMTRAISLLAQAPQLKTPGLANAYSKELMAFVDREISSHVKDTTGGVIVVVSQQA
jgi:hypothetical protein